MAGSFVNSLTSGSLNPLYIAPKPAASAPAAAPKAANNGVFWVGADGKVYVKGSQGTNAAGTADANTSSYWGGKGFTQIADPNAPAPRDTVNTVVQGGGGGSGGSAAAAPVLPDKSNDIAQQNAGLNAVGSYVSSGQAAIDAALAALTGTYDTEAGAEKTSYNTNTDQNKVNLSKNQQTALVNAAQGRQGLNGTLASLGALNGSGIELATRAVQKGANEDLAGASDNYATNAHALDEADAAFTTQDKERRDAAKRAADQGKTKVQNTGLTQQLGYYQQLSNDYADEGDKGNASKYSDLAASLFPEIARTSVPDSAPTYSAATYTAPALASYLAGGNTQVQTTPATAATGGIPGLTAAPVKKKASVTV